MKLYNAFLSPFAGRVRAAIYHKGIEDQVTFVLPPTALNSPEWRAINPIGKIPVLITDGLTLAESEVILEYLEERFPQKPLLPAEAADRALVRTLNRICDLYIFEPFRPLFQQLALKENNTAIIEIGVSEVLDGLRKLEGFLPDNAGPYAIGESPSFADCGLVSTLFCVDRILPAFDVVNPISRFPKLAHYWETANQEPVAQKILKEHQSALEHFHVTGQSS
ncbi:glutathione S-transferase family protein [Govanella unica]|uniref:Glutathione S-transferase family protein n=1 Tax=Govanella unica TaxID=2975056 RepID=A0A9X3Z8C9_9PROT|nr:glutathione S-transferase family protein [Govania unica]MDA5194869.1 glutathione S-transferase family protein [Govania unica]